MIVLNIHAVAYPSSDHAGWIASVKPINSCKQENVSPLMVFAPAIPCAATNLAAEREQHYSVADEARAEVQMSW